MKVKVIDTFGVEREYDSLEEAYKGIDDEWWSTYDSDALLSSLDRLRYKIYHLIHEPEDISRFEVDGVITIKDRKYPRRKA